MMANDIDDFIRAQKSKLKQERQALQSISAQPASDPLQSRNVQQQIPITGGPRAPVKFPDNIGNAFSPPLNGYQQFPAQTSQPSHQSHQIPRLTIPNYESSVSNQQINGPTNLQNLTQPSPQKNYISYIPQNQPGDPPERPLVDKLGEYETRRQRINDQRREEYQRLAAIESRRPLRRRANSDSGPEESTSFPGLKDHESAKTRKEQQRNMEYQEFKRQEEEKFRNRLAHKKPPAATVSQTPHQRQEAFVNPAKPLGPETLPSNYEEASSKPRRQHFIEGLNTFGELEKWQDLLVSQAPPDNNVSRHYRENRLDQLERDLNALRKDGYQPRARPTEPPLPPRRFDDENDGHVRLPIPAASEPKTLNEGNNKSLAGISDRLSAVARRRDERNREYNQHLQEKAEHERTRKAGRFLSDSPRYDDTLTQRRYEDTLRQMLNNPSQQAPREREPRPQPARSKPRYSLLDKELEKLDSLDNQYSAAKTSLYRRDRGFSPPGLDDRVDDLLQLKAASSRLPPRAPPRPAGREPIRQGFARGSTNDNDGVLPVGRNETESAQKRKKDEYRLELERQIQETKERNKREKELDRQPTQPSLTRSRSYNDIIGEREVKKPRARDVFGPIDNGDIGTTDNRGLSLLNRDLENLAGGQPGLTPYTTPADDAYHYYGMKNPLEAAGYGEDSLLSEIGSDVLTRGRSLNSLAANPQTSSKPNRVRFDESNDKGGLTFRSQEDISNVKKQRQKEYAEELQRQIIENQKKKQKAKAEQEAYDRKFEEENSDYDPFGRGGGGAPVKDAEGNVQADLRGVLSNPGDRTGRQKEATPRRQPTSDPKALRLNLSSSAEAYNQRERSTDPQATTPRSARRQTNALGETTHARGGHGIFGQPLTDEQLESRHKFRDDLAQQIAEKRRAKEREKERIRREEEEENQRIEEERRKMKEEEEEERRRKIEKEEETKRKNEEALLKQKREEEEMREREMERRRREEEARKAEKDTGQERWIDQRRTESPPVPAVYNAMKKDGRTPTPRSVKTPQSRRSARDHPSPTIGGPAPAPVRDSAREKPKEEGGSNVALRDLRRMKQQLNSEKERVERALMQQHYSVEVHDPRLTAAPAQRGGIVISNPPVAVVKRTTPDIFDTAREKAKPVPVRRRNMSRTDIPDERQLKDFNTIKMSDTDTGRVIRENHPGTPLSARQLENQQEAYIREQEERLRRLQLNSFNGSRFAADMPGMSPADLGIMTRRLASPDDGRQLHSETAFIGLNGAPFRSSENPWHVAPEAPILPFDDGDSRPAGDNNIDPDYLTRKNEERWKNLKEMERENAELNSNGGDSEEVLARFLEKQGRRSNAGSVSGFPRSKPNNQPPRAPSSGLAAIPPRSYAIHDDLTTHTALDPVHESALDGPLDPDPVSEFSNRDAAVARTNINPSADVELPYKDGPTPLDDTWIQSNY